MNIFAVALGEEDYGRNQFARLTVCDVSLALGHSYYDWIALRLDIDWGHGRWWWSKGLIIKAVPGEQFCEMVLRHHASGWTDS